MGDQIYIPYSTVCCWNKTVKNCKKYEKRGAKVFLTVFTSKKKYDFVVSHFVRKKINIKRQAFSMERFQNTKETGPPIYSFHHPLPFICKSYCLQVLERIKYSYLLHLITRHQESIINEKQSQNHFQSDTFWKLRSPSEGVLEILWKKNVKPAHLLSIKVKILAVLASGFKAIWRMDTGFQLQKILWETRGLPTIKIYRCPIKIKKIEKTYRISQRFGNIHQSVLLYSIFLSTNQISKSFLEDWVLSLLTPSLELWTSEKDAFKGRIPHSNSIIWTRRWTTTNMPWTWRKSQSVAI